MDRMEGVNVEELKPCPFCGGIDIRLNYVLSRARFKVMCENCKCTTNQFLDKNDAIEAWNRRADDGEIKAVPVLRKQRSLFRQS